MGATPPTHPHWTLKDWAKFSSGPSANEKFPSALPVALPCSVTKLRVMAKTGLFACMRGDWGVKVLPTASNVLGLRGLGTFSSKGWGICCLQRPALKVESSNTLLFSSLSKTPGQIKCGS